MRKILLVSNFYSSYISAGTSKRTHDIKKGLSNLGWKCNVVTIMRTKTPVHKEPDKKDIIALRTLSERYPIPLFNKGVLFNLISSSDIVHIIDHWSVLNLITVLFCFLSKTPYIYSPCGALKPLGNNIILKKLYNLFFLNIIINNASCFFAITNKELKEINHLSRKKVKTYVLPNGIWATPEKKFISNKNINKILSNFKIPKKYILFVGRLSIIKGPDILLKAFLTTTIKNEYSLLFAGPDDKMLNKMLSFLKDHVDRGKIFFLGSVSSQERDFLMKNASLTVIPSRSEAMSMVGIESSSLGTPFLATKNCGLEDFEKNLSGFICDGDQKSISYKLDKILKDSKFLKSIGKNSQDYVLSFYTWESIIQKMSFYLDKFKK